MVDAEAVLHGDRGSGKGVVRRRGRQHDQVDRLRVDTGMFQRRTRRVDRQMRGKFTVGGDVALPDAGTLYDPLIGSIQPGGQFGIGQHLLRQIGSAAQHDRTFGQSRDSLLRGLRLSQRTAVAIKHLIDLGEEIAADHLIANIDRIGKALGVGSAMALDHHTLEAEQHAAIGLVAGRACRAAP